MKRFWLHIAFWNRVFSRVLVANRGEIALRVMRTCRELGVTTVAVFSSVDRDAPFVAYADQAYPLGEPKLSESYLNIPKILDIAAKSGADAVHPGYGLLSENPSFAEACRAAGLGFVGPPPSAMRALGGKAASRKLVASVGVPVIPGSRGILRGVDEALATGEALGYPLVLKASAGGGGIGMRVVGDPAELRAAYEATRRMAVASFGDPGLILEKYLDRPRHVEIQVAIDGHGRSIHLFERECSVQRRYQKLLEETPSLALTEGMREAMAQAALRIVEAAGYRNLGTVEFVLSGGKFHFLEVNARLQVEHPITEATTGLDLVRLQLRIAAGEERLPDQSEVSRRGHAIECRINAEDPAKNFMPNPGLITLWKEPVGPAVRVDSGVAEGYTVSPYYDSLLAKLVVHGDDRPTAVARMSKALEEFRVGGVKTTIPFHRAVLEHPDFRSGNYDTHLISRVRSI